jgi:signal transduction histidine kinase
MSDSPGSIRLGPAVKKWLWTGLLPVAALLLRLALHPLLGTKGPFFTFFMATLASAAMWGFRPGIVSTLISVLLAKFIYPLLSGVQIVEPGPTTLIQFAIAACVVSVVCEWLIVARERARGAELRLRDSEQQLQLQAEELKRSNRDLEQFAFVASHDMQEPLRTVNIYAQMLVKRANVENSAELAQYAGYVSEGVERMERLIGDLLNYSRVIHGDADKEPVNASAAAAEAVKISQDLIDKSGASVVVDPLPTVLAEKGHLVQVFQNLISNSIKYRREGEPPRIHVSAAVEDGKAVFRVRDNGIGIEPEYSEKVFRLFARLHGNQYQGSGLGLAICHRIVERYGGRIWVESKLGEGSTFCFALPAANEGTAKRAAAK